MIRRLWVRFVLFYVAVVSVAICVASLYAHYHLRSFFVRILEEDLLRTARTLEPLLHVEPGGGPMDALCGRLKERSGYRVTVIARDGTVLGDSDRDSATMENHLYRPEVREALERGSGTAVRFSHTVAYPMLYRALFVPAQPDPYFIRLSVPLRRVDGQLAGIRRTVVKGSLLGFLAALPLLFMLSRRMSRRINRVTAFVQDARRGRTAPRLFVGSRDELGLLERELDEIAVELSGRLEDLATERKRLQGVLDGIQDGLIFLDSSDRIVFVNPAARRIAGCGRQTVVGRRLMEVIRSEELHGLIRKARDQGGTAACRRILLPRDPDRAFVATAMDLRNTAGKAAGDCLVLIRDVSEHERLERARADFLSRVSHELRTPLTLVKGFVETLQEEGFQDPGQAARYLSVIRDNTDRLVRLVGDLVRLSSIELGRMPVRVRPVQLGELIQRAVRSFEVRAKEKGLVLVWEVPDGLPRVQADPDRLLEILFNLLDNAIKFTPGGEVRVRAAPVEGPGRSKAPGQGDGPLEFPYAPSGTVEGAGGVVLVVADTGVGIPPGVLPRVTERFFRGEGEEAGAGLGLAIVKHLVKLMGGELSIRSREGEGTTVKVTLPAEPEGNARSGLAG